MFCFITVENFNFRIDDISRTPSRMDRGRGGGRAVDSDSEKTTGYRNGGRTRDRDYNRSRHGNRNRSGNGRSEDPSVGLDSQLIRSPTALSAGKGHSHRPALSEDGGRKSQKGKEVRSFLNGLGSVK